MKRKVIMGLIILIMLSGIGLMAYPSLANFINNQFAVQIIDDYQNKIDSTDKKELDEMMEKAYSYNNSLPGAFPADPFSGSNISKQAQVDYQDFFMIQPDAMIGYIEVPKADIYLPVYYGTSEEVLKKGVGLIKNSSLPVGGESSHAVLSAHTGLPSQELFTGIEELEDGDMFFIHVLDQIFAYEVNQKKVVLPEETSDLMIEKDKTYITLLTCTPYGINSHRLLVRGELIQDYDFTTESYTPMAKGIKKNDWLWILILACVAIALLSLLIVFVIKRRKGKKEGVENE